MTSDRWSKLRRLHATALNMPAAERDAYLREECGDDHGLLNEVLGLLREQADNKFLTSPPPSEGVRLADFELKEELGSGGTGIVYRAFQTSLNREVALKLLPSHFTLNTERVERFQREAKAAAKMSHPCIAAIYEVGHEGDSYFFTMELVEGIDLAGELLCLRDDGNCRLPKINSPEYFQAVAKIVKSCAGALSYAHSKGVVHRDVKPHNIMLDPDGNPRLVDFGLAKDEALGSITVTDRVEGTPYYMSPEQARAVKGQIDERTDVYSLGAVLYELLTLSRPYTGGTSKEVIDKILVRDPKPVRDCCAQVPVDLAVICAKAMEKELAFRYGSAEELEQDLQRFLAGEPILAKPMSLARKLGRAGKQHQLGIGLVAAAALIVFASTSAYNWAAEKDWVPVEFVAQDSQGEIDPGEVQVFAIPMDAVGARTGDAIRLGGLPIEESLAPGVWQIQMQGEGGNWAELICNLPPGRALSEYSIALVNPEVSSKGMIRIDPELWNAKETCEFLPDSILIPPFLVDSTPVTVDEYRAFCAATGHPTPPYWSRVDVSGLPGNYPVGGVSQSDAKAYANWAGKRLLSHLEMEYLLRGVEGRQYPWGDEPLGPEHANPLAEYVPENTPEEVRFEHLLTSISPVGTFQAGANPDGVLDLLGGIIEHLGTPAPSFDANVKVPDFSFSTFFGFGFQSPPNARGDRLIHGTSPVTGKVSGEWGARTPIEMGFRCAKSVE